MGPQCTTLLVSGVSQAATNVTHFTWKNLGSKNLPLEVRALWLIYLGFFLLKILNNYMVFITNSHVKFSVPCGVSFQKCLIPVAFVHFLKVLKFTGGRLFLESLFL